MKLHFSPVSSYSQKVQTAFYEKGVDFEPAMVDLTTPEGRAAWKKVYPLGKVPVLVLDDGWMIPESSIIIEYLDTHFDSGTRLIPADKDAARQTRFFDRQADLYLNDSMTKVLFDGWKPPEKRDPDGVALAKTRLDGMYGWWNQHLAKNTFLMGDGFTMADCAAAPSLAYLAHCYPFTAHANIVAYFNRLVERPSFARVQKEAAPFIQALMSAG